MVKVDLRKVEWREAIVELADAIKNTPLTDRALALLIADCSTVSLTQALAVIKAIPTLPDRYLKK